EVLEARTMMTSVSGTTDIPLGPIHSGDTVYVTATLNTNDPNEDGEGEPLVLQSSGGWSATINTYGVTHTMSFQATQDGESLVARIPGQDNDESADVTVDTNQSKPRLYTQAQKDAFQRQADELHKASLAESALA